MAEVTDGAERWTGRVERLGHTVVVRREGDAEGALHIGWQEDGYAVVRGPWAGATARVVSLEESAVKSVVKLLKRVASSGRKEKDRTFSVRDVTGREIPIPMEAIEPGGFVMGAMPDDASADYRERQHAVTLTRRYALAASPVTQGLWFAVTGGTPSRFRTGGEAALRPVEQVSWFDAIRFCNQLSEKCGLETAYRFTRSDLTDVRWVVESGGFRLPTEAEWEFAARAGTEFRYSGGNNIDNVAWVDGNSGGTTHPVMRKAPNEFGLYDMSGNVWEWCWDLSGDYPVTAVSDPAGSTYGSSRVARGGSHYDGHNPARVTNRKSYSADKVDYHLGFRLCRTLP
jgi:formylglycine-generating enzyme required for sulfatase activity